MLKVLRHTIQWFGAIASLTGGAIFLYFISTRGIDYALEDTWKPAELVTVLLTVATIALTVLGIGIAVAAFFGYASLQNSVRGEVLTALQAQTVAADKANDEAIQRAISEAVRNALAAQRLVSGGPSEERGPDHDPGGDSAQSCDDGSGKSV